MSAASRKLRQPLGCTWRPDAPDCDRPCVAGFAQGFARPRVVMLLVLDGMRGDYFDRYSASMPTLTALRQRSAWFTQARVNFLPTNTAVGHSTLSTGADPRVHGITGVSVYERTQRRRHDFFAGGTPQDLMALTLADVWQLATTGRAIYWHRAASTGRRRRSQGMERVSSMGCQSFSPATIRNGQLDHKPQLFPAACISERSQCENTMASEREWISQNRLTGSTVFGSVSLVEANAMATMIEREPLGEDNVPDLILLNYKGADFVGHKYGPDSDELRVTLGEMDRQLKRMLSVLEAKVVMTISLW